MRRGFDGKVSGINERGQRDLISTKHVQKQNPPIVTIRLQHGYSLVTTLQSLLQKQKTRDKIKTKQNIKTLTAIFQLFWKKRLWRLVY